jgi:putative ABC transport system permease protein
VVSQLDQSADALSSLEGIEAVASYSLAGALVSAAAILFLIMLMIVRERRQEIGVLKAIGASNFKVVKQFIFEALTFTLIAGLLGIGVGIIFSNPVLEVLVNSNTTTTVADAAVGIGSERGPGAVMRGAAATSDQSALENITAVVNYELIVYGLGAAIAIAIIGSAVPSWLIAKVRPAEAMRGE